MDRYMHITVDYYEGEGEGYPEPLHQYRTPGDLKKWCMHKGVPLSILRYTIWDESEVDGYGCPSIVSSGNADTL